MTHDEAVTMLRPVRIEAGGRWADLGAGRGRFSLALAELLGAEGAVYAVDKNARDLEGLQAPPQPGWAAVHTLERDFTEPLGLDALSGILMANALHYVRNPVRLLGQLMFTVQPGGKLVVIEYDTRRANPWVPFPVAFTRLGDLAARVGLPAPQRVHTRASSYGRSMYVAVLEIPELRK